jgi:phosphoglycolate phosphatase
MKKTYQYIVWDWNGTLLDDAWVCCRILNEMRVGRGMTPVTVAEYKKSFAFPVIEYYRKIGFDFEKEDWNTMAKEFADMYEAVRDECSLRSDARETIAKVSWLGFRQVVLSAYRQHLLEEVVDSFGLTQYFTAMVGVDNHYAAGKADRANHLVELLACPTSELLFVGDTTHDHEVATSVGADCVLVAGGHQDRERLEKCRCTVVGSLAELASLLDVSNDAAQLDQFGVASGTVSVRRRHTSFFHEKRDAIEQKLCTWADFEALETYGSLGMTTSEHVQSIASSNGTGIGKEVGDLITKLHHSHDLEAADHLCQRWKAFLIEVGRCAVLMEELPPDEHGQLYLRLQQEGQKLSRQIRQAVPD